MRKQYESCIIMHIIQRKNENEGVEVKKKEKQKQKTGDSLP